MLRGSPSVPRFIEAGHGDVLSTFLELLEPEAEGRRYRHIIRLRQEFKLPR